ncbi:transmembrane protein 52B isoform X2 [Podarcis raffonei]|uniref:transmembrane protein 52B isoform X2 n=1 Tax=Podarcis raffonei TaxID=65483 RepID=UPI0023292F8C|nr:transmembrane protein 52B isoform X2 [Podarcis raffonei]
MGKTSRVVTISALTCLSQIPQVTLQETCSGTDHSPQSCSSQNWVHLWYIWYCCLHCHPAGEDDNSQPYEVTVIAFDHDSTLQSTITSFHSVFGPAARRMLAVAHSHSVLPAIHYPAGMETPPIYEEAVHMSRFRVARSGEPAPESQPEEKQSVDAEKGQQADQPSSQGP